MTRAPGQVAALTHALTPKSAAPGAPWYPAPAVIVRDGQAYIVPPGRAFPYVTDAERYRVTPGGTL